MKIVTFLTILIKITWCEYDSRIITTLKYSKYHVVPTIVNGDPAYQGQMPYLVSIKEPARKLSAERILWTSICGASIISEARVLTAAHCFEGNNFFFSRHPEILRLVAGSLKNNLVHSGEIETNEQMQWRKIHKVILHKDFVFPENDIALIFVDVPWNFTSYINYAVTINIDYPRTCYSCGFGRTGHSLRDTITPMLIQARIDVMPSNRCSTIWEMNMKSFICTSSAVTDVAQGDSGGPLGCTDTLDPAEVPGKDLLVGVVSGKNYDKTSIFTRVSQYADWIANPVPMENANLRFFHLNSSSNNQLGFMIKCVQLFIITFLVLK